MNEDEIRELIAELRRGELAYMSESGPVYQGPTALHTSSADALELLLAQWEELFKLRGRPTLRVRGRSYKGSSLSW